MKSVPPGEFWHAGREHRRIGAGQHPVLRQGKRMFDFLKPNPAAALLKDDHKRVKKLFDEFEKTNSRPRRVKIVEQALEELKVHAAIEEEIFYAAVRSRVGKDIMNEADEEHH